MQKIISLVRSLLARPAGRYLLVGGSVYALELAIILIAQAMGASSIAAVAIAYVIGTTVSFGLQKFFTFGDKRTHHKVVLTQVVAVSLLLLFNFGFTLLATKLLQDTLPAIVVRTLALLTTTVWNFLLYKTHIFKKTDIEPII